MENNESLISLNKKLKFNKANGYDQRQGIVIRLLEKYKPSENLIRINSNQQKLKKQRVT